MTYCVDRFEGCLAILLGEDRSPREVELSRLPGGVREGDYIRETPDGFVPAPEIRETAEARIAEKLRRLRGE